MTDDALPEGLRRLWGIAPRTREARGGLTVARVVEAAVEVADADGLDAVSMSRVAKRLGFTTMALYRHVASKDELLQLMRDVASGDPPPLPEDQGWRAATSAWTWAQFEIARRHPWISQVAGTGPPLGPHQVAWMEAGLRALRDSGLHLDERFGLIGILSGHVLHEVTFTSELARHRGDRSAADVEREYGRRLASVVDEQRFPELTALLATGLFEGDDETPQPDPDPAFAFGLELLLDGVELLVQRRS